MKEIKSLSDARRFMCGARQLAGCQKAGVNSVTARMNAVARNVAVEIGYFVARDEKPDIPFVDGLKGIRGRVVSARRLGNGSH